MLHYPPFDSKHNLNEFGLVLKILVLKYVFMGIFMGRLMNRGKQRYIDGIRFHLISCNIIDFMPVEIWPKFNVSRGIVVKE